MKKILLPVDFPDTPTSVVRQVAYLARHFRSEVIVLHVVSPLRFPAGLLERGHRITERDLTADIVRQAEYDLQQALPHELDGIVVRRLMCRGDPAQEILRTAQAEEANLVAISTRGRGALYRLLLGSVAAKVLHKSACPVWSDACGHGFPVRDFAIRNVLCAVDLTPHSRHTVSRAAELSADFGAKLTLVHITAGVDSYGPGGLHVDAAWKESLVRFASEGITQLQQDAGTEAEVIIQCGKVQQLLKRAAEQSRADILVIGHMPADGHLGQNGGGYAIIRDSPIPVLSL
jgi:nucleotide-binding universal stress UspA family protein